MLKDFHALFQHFFDWTYENITEHPHIAYPVVVVASVLIIVFIYYLFATIFEQCDSVAKLCGLL